MILEILLGLVLGLFTGVIVYVLLVKFKEYLLWKGAKAIIEKQDKVLIEDGKTSELRVKHGKIVIEKGKYIPKRKPGRPAKPKKKK